MARQKLTAKGVEALTTDKRQEDFWDTLTPGLALRVSGTTGRKTWMVRYRANGKHRRMKLGAFPHMGLADARKDARDTLAEAEAGEDPAAQPVVESTGEGSDVSFRAMTVEVLKARARKGRHGEPTRESTQQERQRIVDRHLLPTWGDRDADAISKREVVKLVEGIADDGAGVMANRVLALIHLLFNDAIRRGFPGVEHNPAHLVEPPGVEGGRDRYLGREEFPALWKATQPENPLTRAAFRLTFLTAQRIGSILAMRWPDIQENGSGHLWTIPAEHFKGRRIHLVPLSVEAVEIVNELREIALHDEWVFPSRAGSKHPHLTNMGRALTRIRKRSELDHWTLHDARTTFRTWAVRSPEDGGLGVAAPVADAVLGHKEPTLGFNRYTGDQDRYLLSEKREALTAWGAWVREAVEGGR